MRRTLLFAGLVLALVAPVDAARPVSAAKQAYDRALSRERALAARATPDRPPPVSQVRAIIASYENVVRRFPRSGYADNALWQAAGLWMQLYDRSGAESDRRRAERMLEWLVSEYPSSRLVADAKARLARGDQLRVAKRRDAGGTSGSATPDSPLDAVSPSSRPGAVPTATRASRDSSVRPAVSRQPAEPDPAPPPPDRSAAAPASSLDLVSLQRAVLPDFVRLTVELSGEAQYAEGRLDAPSRVYFDLENTTARAELADKVLAFADDVVREIRIGRRSEGQTRVAVDLEGVSKYTVFRLYSPHRLVVDFERTAGRRDDVPAQPARPARVAALDAAEAPALRPPPTGLPFKPAARETAVLEGMALPDDVLAAPAKGALAPSPVLQEASRATAASAASRPAPEATAPAPARRSVPLSKDDLAPGASAAGAPLPPAANAGGGLSVARQLGLGISRIVIDPGHGGHDPGALGRRITEAELVLDVGLRLEKLLQKSGYAVVMTRRDDRFIPLEERTALANREAADLFLSIHANAGRNSQARGVETYFLNFATNPDAIAVAARENASSGQTMHNLPDIVRAITLNSKIDESRDFAAAVQKAMVRRLRPHNPVLKDLGVKQAPFVVLIGATMPSVLAEISFITNVREGALLRTSAYRQRIAEALFDAVTTYQKALKTVNEVASLPHSSALSGIDPHLLSGSSPPKFPADCASICGCSGSVPAVSAGAGLCLTVG